jgi:hypothetical protein
MITSRLQSSVRATVAAIAIATAALGVAGTTPVGAAGLANCVDLTGPNSGRVGCYEDVWANGQERRMVFSNQGFDGATPRGLDAFYVLAPQSAIPQGDWAPFRHDHVVRDVPAGNHGSYTTKMQGFFVLCTGDGLVSGACAPTWMAPPGVPAQLPFATTVNGHHLTSTDAIEAAADAGLVSLLNLGPNAVIVGTISGH